MLHVQIGGYDDGERGLLVRSLSELCSTDLLVMDRGFPAWWFFAVLAQRGIAFCARLDGGGYREVSALLRSHSADMVVQRRLNARDLRQLAQAGGQPAKALTLKLRLVRVVLPNGHIEVLATSLLDSAAHPASAFGALYGSRWRIEEGFKTLKQRLHLEGFTGELPHAIEQEIHAKVLVANITAALSSQAHAQLPDSKAQTYQVNQTVAIKHWPMLVAKWLIKSADEFELELTKSISLLTRSLEKVRPHRSFPRNFGIGGAARPRRAYH
jgi:hypothetical protein